MKEGYPDNWQHCVIHLDTETGEMHSDGDHRVRKWIQDKLRAGKNNEKVYLKALALAAEEAYQNEVVDTDTEHMTIGKDQEYASKEEWIETRITGWIEEAISNE